MSNNIINVPTTIHKDDLALFSDDYKHKCPPNEVCEVCMVNELAERHAERMKTKGDQQCITHM